MPAEPPPPPPGFFDYWLRGQDEAEVLAALAAAGIATGPADTSAYDPIGTIWKDTGTVDADGNPVMEPLPGWHANLRLTYRLRTEQRAEMSYVLIDPPANPARVWASSEEQP